MPCSLRPERYVRSSLLCCRINWCRAKCDFRMLLRWQLVPAEILAFGGAHLRHGGVRLAVVVVGVPEKKSDATFVLCGQDLDFNVFGRIGFGAPREGLQPGPQNHAAVLGDQLE